MKGMYMTVLITALFPGISKDGFMYSMARGTSVEDLRTELFIVLAHHEDSKSMLLYMSKELQTTSSRTVSTV
ncbi:hypothetical protein FB446DRAFT_749121 [Lentinula raphanica]|nr:hypothetical protein FB446DRAFT_749121 [Lentinula raphanica]